MRLLLIEDEAELALLVQRILQRSNYVVDIAPDVATAQEALLSSQYEIVICDRVLPDGDGVEILRFAKKKNIQSRFLVLSALGETSDRVKGLDLGADDYLVKPFEPDELLARIRALLRRPLPEGEQVWECGRIKYNNKSRRISIDKQNVIFARRELIILELLIKSAGRVVTRDFIDQAVYGYDDEIQSNTLESHISRIRKTLNQHDANVSIHAVRGVGYIMKAD